MWFVRVLFTVALLAAIVLFIAANLTATVSVDLVYERFDKSPLVTVVVVAFLAGIAVGLIAAAGQFLAARAEARRMAKEVRMIEDELAVLRNMPLADLDEPVEKP